MRICLCFNVLFLRFCRENGGAGVMDLVYGSSSSLYMDCEVKIVLLLPIRLYRVRLSHCSCVDAFVVGPRHTWMYPLRFILLQDEY